MKIFIDSADIDQIRQAYSWGIVDGVTTNPSLIKAAKEKHGKQKPLSIRDYIKEILLAAGKDPVSLEVIGPGEEAMYREALTLYETFNGSSDNVVIKIPVNPATSETPGGDFDGLKVIRRLAEQDIPVNVTLVMTPEQALLAAKAGARYVSPFAGRIDDDLRKRQGMTFGKGDYFQAEGLLDQNGEPIVHDNGVVSGVDLVEQIVTIFATYGITTKVLAASLRNARQVRECAQAGADIGTIPFPVIEEMVRHHKTREGMKAFLADVVPEYAALFK
ncbi:MAG: transaldolase family protein [Planctomycetota bacterium]